MPERKEHLTNEKIKKRFISQFDLVNYAIRLASNMIQTGRDCRVKVDSQNRALQILTEIYLDKDQFDDIIIEEIQEEPSSYRERGEDSYKNRESKKSRKILAE